MKTQSMVLALTLFISFSNYQDLLLGLSELEAKEVQQEDEPKKFTEQPMQGFPASAESQVTLSNWTLQPYNKWAFRNAGIMPSLMVPRGGPIHSFAKNPGAPFDNLPIEYNGQQSTLDEVLKADDTDGFIVLKNGEIVYEKYFGDFTEHNHHLWASSTKSLVGLCVGILESQGLIDSSERIETYAPTLKGSGFEGLTVRQVLNMVSALEYSEDYADLRPGTVHYEYFRRIGLTPAFDLMALDPKVDATPRGNMGFIPEIRRSPSKNPGEVFEYHSPNVDVIGMVISRVSGLSLEEFVSNYVWKKLHPEHDAFFATDAAFNPIATGGFNSTLRDFARFGLAVINDGVFAGNQIFPATWIEDTYKLADEEVEAGQRSVYRDQSLRTYDDKLLGYKNFWWIHNREKRIMMARGVFGQGLYIDKSRNVVIATFGSASSASNAQRDTWKMKVHAMQVVAETIGN